MKTCQSTGYFQQVPVILLLCLVSSVVFAGSALALTGNNINACFDCHGSLNDIRPLDTSPAGSLSSYRNITSGAVKGSHRTHVTNLPATLIATTCNSCHGATVTAFDHRDGRIQMEPAVAYTKTPFFNQTSVPVLGTCSTASCHSNPYGTGNVVSPTWGTVSGCASCHNSTSGVNAAFDATYGAPLTGAHNMHMATLMACNKCHSNVAKDTNTSSVHINTFINVSGYNPKQVNKHAINSGYGTCTTTLCHGSASPNWGTVTTNVACTKCHGKPAVLANYSSTNAWQSAPGYAQSAGAPYVSGVSATQPYGAHDSHLRGTSGYVAPYQIKCSDCHSIPVSGSHANRTTDFAWSNLARNVGTDYAANGVLTAGYTRPTCSTNYCHGGGFVAAVKGTGLTPSWVDTTYLPNAASAKNATDCNKCHLSPPLGSNGGGVNSAHSGMVLAALCDGCHGHNGTGPGHINGKLEAGGTSCDGCHDYDTVGTTWGTVRNKNYGGTLNKEGVGAHAKHINYIKTRWARTLNATADYSVGYGLGNAAAVCGVCHSNTVGDHSTGAPANPRSINFANGGRQFGLSAPAYNGLSNTSSTVNNKSCSNLDCHYLITPVWSAP